MNANPRQGRRPARRARCTTALVLAALGGGCGEPDVGVLEFSWEFVDRDGAKIYPGGLFEPASRDACDLPAKLGTSTVTYDLGVELEICDTSCAQGCGDPDCLVVPPLRFGCKTFRGSNPDIPASDAKYRFTMRAVIEIDQTGDACLEPTATCIGVPGPRDRWIEGGLVTDLQVYQIAVDVDLDGPESGRYLDLEGCGCG